jgi:hypothetical protein
MVKLGGRSISPVVLIGGVVVLLAVTLAFAVPAFMGGQPGGRATLRRRPRPS